MFVKSVRSQTDFLRFENRCCKVWKWSVKGSQGKCSVCFGGVHEATYIKPTGPISGHLVQSVGQLLGYPRHLQEQTITYVNSL